MMGKRIVLVIALAVASALAVPSVAGASQLTNSGGGSTPVGTKLTIRSISHIRLTTAALGTLDCAGGFLNMELTKNSGFTVEGVGVGVGEVALCETEKKVSFSTSDLTLTNFKSTVSGEGTVNFSMAAKIASVSCQFTGTNVKFTYAAGNTFRFTKATGVTGGNCGSTQLDGEFELEKVGGGSVILE
jgi:hypothetical protein